ncbi:alcohol acyltransferase 9-like [Actinidia eriantha]|uniref:alcohol acyltransferase 9-like n=1 Tax=Actinidia eriantha TaxID=165200 RepID=UPI00258818E7|nr:alcohol acyltransferase 9-like [Actinidia eriantha]
MASFVRLVTKPVLVAPSDPTPSTVLSLSSLDSQLFLRFPIEYLLVYASPHDVDRVVTAARVKAALARSLVPYYPLAGRVRARSDGTGLDMLCRAQGAGFLEAVSDYTASNFQRAPRSVTEWRKLLLVEVFKVVPPLVVQLTWLSDGCVALGIGLSHSAIDGIGSSEFLNLFAELATGRAKLSEFKPKPVWDRHLLDSAGRTNLGTHPEFSRVPDLSRFVTLFAQERLSPTSITFDKTWLKELKNLAMSTSQHGEFPYTSFEVLSGHIWRSWARSLNLPAKQILKLLFSINIRNRVQPSLPAGYYGNAFVLGIAQTSVKDLTEKGLGYCADLVSRAKERVGDEYVREVVESVSWPRRASPDSVGVLIISQWSRLGLDRVDFGMGRPAHVGPICCDRYCLFLPVRDRTDAVKVMVAVPTSVVDRYEHLVRSPNS